MTFLFIQKDKCCCDYLLIIKLLDPTEHFITRQTFPSPRNAVLVIISVKTNISLHCFGMLCWLAGLGMLTSIPSWVLTLSICRSESSQMIRDLKWFKLNNEYMYGNSPKCFVLFLFLYFLFLTWSSMGHRATGCRHCTCYWAPPDRPRHRTPGIPLLWGHWCPSRLSACPPG